jgi:uncharacterized protein (TIGR02246 family)
MKKIILPPLAVAFAFFTCLSLAADDPAEVQAKKIAGDVFQSYARAYASGNAEAVAAHWKSDGEIVDAEGMRTLGRAAIEKTFADFFANNRGSKITIQLISAKPEGENVIVAEICPKIDPPISKSICEVGAMVVLVKDADGKWLIEGVREKNPLPASYEHLKQLEWMVGDWTVNAKKAENVVFSLHCHWTENKSFLICMYTAKHLDVVRHGTQVIGWDAKEKKIRSWMFDSNGGFAGGFWEKAGNRWSIELSGTSPEGEGIKGTQILAAVDADTFTFESTNRSKGGEKIADVPLLEMQRVKSHLPSEK